MPRPSIEDVRPPPKLTLRNRFPDLPDIATTIETESCCIENDAETVRLIEKEIAKCTLNRKHRRAAKRVIRYFDKPPKDRRLSAASRVKMRDWRIHVCGWLLTLVHPLSADEWVAFTIVLPSWWCQSRDLKRVNAKRLMARLRVALARAGSGEASGWLYAMIHGEFDGTTRGFSIHVHGIATKKMIEVLRNLRKQPQFQRNKIDQTRYPMIGVTRKLVLQKPQDDYAGLITYTSKSYWPQHNSRIDPDGVRRRFGRKHRIVGKHFVRCLHWLNSQRVKDQVLLVHLSVVDGQLVVGKRGDRKS